MERMLFIYWNVFRGPVHLAGRQMDKLLNRSLKRRLAEVQRAFDICFNVALRSTIGVGNWNQGGKMEENVHILSRLRQK